MVQGVLHTVAGYLLYTSLTFKYVFDHHHDDVYWCTADIGWITGHSYITYGPLANGATSVLVSLKMALEDTFSVNASNSSWKPNSGSVCHSSWKMHVCAFPTVWRYSSPPSCRPVLGDHWEVQSHQVLHSSYSHPPADEVWTGTAAEVRAGVLWMSQQVRK